jgi:alkylated DNA repair protein alkB family protein 6
VQYAPCALRPAHGAALLACVDAPAYAAAWVELRGRRLQRFGGEVTPKGLLRGGGSDGGRTEDALPPYLQALAALLVEAGVFPPEFRPNHALVNDYAPGEGIMAHTDGPAYYPRTATVSLGGGAMMRFCRPRLTSTTPAALEAMERTRDLPEPMDLFLEADSLVTFSDAAYSHWLHAITEDYADCVAPRADGDGVWVAATPGENGAVLVDRTRRVSITMRHVPLLQTE